MISIVLCSFLLASACHANPFDRIVGGSDADIKDYPHQVSLRLNNLHFCGGSIIGQRWILTSAGCFLNKDLTKVTAVVGTTQLSTGGTTYKISRLIWHEYFNSNTYEHNIAVVEVTQKIETSTKVKIIKLSDTAVPDNTLCKFSGWGLTSYPSEVNPNNLQQIELSTISLQICVANYPTRPIYNTQICTYKSIGQGACVQDGGGALVYKNVQIGIGSWIMYCARGYPDVFTSVPLYREWIRSKTGI